MEYVLTENGNIKIDSNGQPMVKDGDKEFGIDAIGAQAKISSITQESNQRRKDLGEARTQLEAFSGIEDPKKAMDALQKVSSFDKDLTTQLDNLKSEVNKAWEAKEATWNEEKGQLNNSLFKANVLSNFSNSPVAKTLVLTPSIAAKEFGSSFGPDGIAKDASGNVIYSQSKPGEPASFDEALQVLIDTHPEKDSILKSQQAPGGDGFKKGNGQATQNKSARDKIISGLAARNK